MRSPGLPAAHRSTLPPQVYPHAYQDTISLFSFDSETGEGCEGVGESPSRRTLLRRREQCCPPTPLSGSRAVSAPPGRSYKYYDGSSGAPLISFGEGQSYSTFSAACAGGLSPDRSAVDLSCNVSNAAAGPDGDEVLMAFHRPSAGVVGLVAGRHPLPLSALVGFERVSVPAGGTVAVALSLPAAAALAYVNEVGASVLYAGTHFIDVSNGNGFNQTFAVEVAATAVLRSPPPLPA